MTKDIENIIKKEVARLVKNHWQFLENPWPTLQSQYSHRSINKEIKDMKHIKQVLLEKLGVVPVFYFLTNISTVDLAYPYNNIEKRLILLYQIVSGITQRSIALHMPYSSFNGLYHAFWDTNKNKDLSKTINNAMTHMFSSLTLRIAMAKLNNPHVFRHVTLLLDGHDSRIHYRNDKSPTNKKDLYSYKFKNLVYGVKS
jgi:hypothetical protein